jgi:hypothetical protein
VLVVATLSRYTDGSERTRLPFLCCAFAPTNSDYSTLRFYRFAGPVIFPQGFGKSPHDSPVFSHETR